MTICPPSSSISARTASIATRRRPEAPRLSHRARHRVPRAGALDAARSSASPPRKCGGRAIPDGGSVHLLEWPEIDAGWRDDALGANWDVIRAIRERVTESDRAAAPREGDRLEPRGRRSLVSRSGTGPRPARALADLAEICIVSEVGAEAESDGDRRDARPTIANAAAAGGICPRCRGRRSVRRCDEVVNG